MKKILLVVLFMLVFVLLPVAAEEQKTQSTADNPVSEEFVTKTYTLHYVTPKFIQDSLRIFWIKCSYAEGSNLISVFLSKKDIAAFEEQLRKLDVEKKTITLRIFTVIAGKEGTSDAIENKDLKKVLAEVSNLLNFKSYVLDGASSSTTKDGAEFGRVVLSSAIGENLQLNFKRISISTGSDKKRSVKLGLSLMQKSNNQELLNSETEIAEDGYLVAGVSRIGNEGKSLVLVINAEIK
jgi:hypothetical protein